MAWRLSGLTLALCLLASGLRADEVEGQLAAIARSGPQGAGSAEARTAASALGALGADALPRLVVAMQTENPVAANWYRSAYETIVERELAAAKPDFPVVELRAFVADPKHLGRVRRLVLVLCDRLDPGYSNRLIPQLIDDPEFRDDAVERALAAGQKAVDEGDSETARAEFRQAFEHARDSGQTVRAAAKLAGFGEQADIAAHLGLVVDWWLVGPFDAPGFGGYAREFPPEKHLDLQARFVGQDGLPIGWTRHRATDPLGLVNLAVALAPVKEAVGYAYTQLTSPDDRPAQVRCGADDNCTVWLNGQKVFGREQWLNGTRFDRFISPIKLRRGSNDLLVKICQGPPNKDPQVANNWSLQLRITDESGNGLALRSASPEPAEAPK
jgi:hypothetical protein